MEIVEASYKLASNLPSEERYGLRSQITRAAVSVPSNIAEGSAKSSSKDYKNYLEIALGSSFELETQLLILERLGYGESDLRNLFLKEVDEEQKMLMRFIVKLKER